jgi:transposase
LYKCLENIQQQKEQIEQIAIAYAKKHLAFDFSLVFYDVTTLYFETFKEDTDERKEDQKEPITKGLRKPGFSKDGKPLQPQIVIGLVVNRDGYPIAIEIFSGNTFEGKTMLPVIKRLQQKYAITTLTIVADAGMLSFENIEAIKEAKLNYIVGARLGSIAKKTLKTIATELNKREDIFSVTKTNHGTLICAYSEKRAIKDRSDRKKQIARAEAQIENPERVKRRARFVTEETKATLKLNQELINHDEDKEGIKGYYTNLTLNEKLTANDIIARYKDLWHVEKSFRIAKSDLEARPIFHHKRKSIEAHILIVFVSLCMAKAIELISNKSIKQVRKLVWSVLDITCKDTLTGKTLVKRMETTGNPMAELWKTLVHEY